MISVFLNLLRLDLWPNMWYILKNVPCALEKKVYSYGFGWKVLITSAKSTWSNVSFKVCVSLLILCFDDLSIGETGVLKSPTIIVWLSISLLMPVLISPSVVSDSLRPHRLQHTGLPCPSPTTRVYPNSCPSSQWWHPTISSSVISFSRLQFFPASGSLVSQFFTLGGQTIGISAWASVFPMNIQDSCPLG